jgi:hypothetical protein
MQAMESVIENDCNAPSGLAMTDEGVARQAMESLLENDGHPVQITGQARLTAARHDREEAACQDAGGRIRDENLLH